MFEAKGERLGSNSIFSCPSPATHATWSEGPITIASGITPTKIVFSAIEYVPFRTGREDNTLGIAAERLSEAKRSEGAFACPLGQAAFLQLIWANCIDGSQANPYTEIIVINISERPDCVCPCAQKELRKAIPGLEGTPWHSVGLL